MSKEIDTLLGRAFSGDGASWHVYDLYPSCQEALIQAIRSGEDFDTGWWGVKKEIHSGRIRRKGKTVTCEASVSNDFDEEGKGRDSFTVEGVMHPQRIMGKISRALTIALQKAKEDQREYAVVVGFTVLRNGREIGYYLAPMGDGHGLPKPPGDYYSHWGYGISSTEGRERPAPEEVIQKIAAFCEDPEPTECEFESGRAVLRFKHGTDEYKVITWGND